MTGCTSHVTTDLAIEYLSEDAILLRFGDSIDEVTNARVHAAARALRKTALPGLADIAPAYASVLLRVAPGVHTDNEDNASPHAALLQRVREILDGVTAEKLDRGPRRDDDHVTTPSSCDATVVEIPVCYAGDFGPDLVTVAAHAGLTPEAVITRHSEAGYTVAMLGFAPGFPYLLGLDPALHMRRRADPRLRVPAGSVAIGGAQTGIYPRELPGGWNLIGRTPLMLFDAHRDPPALLAPGDRVRFRAIDANEFTLLREQSGHDRPSLESRDK